MMEEVVVVGLALKDGGKRINKWGKGIAGRKKQSWLSFEEMHLFFIF